MAQTFHQFIHRVEMFRDFTEQEVDGLLRITNRKRIRSGERICKQGEEGHAMYIIREGVVRVGCQSDDGNEFTLARLSAGTIIGEMALVDEAPRSASLIAESDTVLYEIRRADFDLLKDEMDPAAYKLLRQLGSSACTKLRNVNEQIQFYLDNPSKLFEPDVESGIQQQKTMELGGRLLKLFGKRK